MPAIDGSLRRHASCAACLTLLVLLARPASAQQPVAAPSTPEFFPRYDFHLSAAALATDDPQFAWDVHLGGDLDLVDYVAGRTSLLVDFEAVLGNELRAFDPNQGNYTLEASSSVRVGGLEVAAMFQHVSRHLTDRPKPFSISWNVVGLRLLCQASRGGTTIDVDVDAGRVVQHAWVDYRWIGDASVRLRRPMTPHTAVFARASGHLIGVDAALRSRDLQAGGGVESGIRLSGSGGAVELFGGYERRLDADPLHFTARPWAFVGFRLVR